MKDLGQLFHDAMIDIYLRAKRECKYTASRFLQMVTEKGGIEAARALIQKDGGTEGFTKLWELRRLDLSVEALVLQEQYRELFTDQERTLCRDRLEKYGYKF
ncbi:MAG: hypothetical protein P4L49_08355 [Desulfosporosinus sp.]|nr:hypothetical protein [Desulfosporosinus sp.]